MQDLLLNAVALKFVLEVVIACVMLVLCVGNPKVRNKRRVRCLVGWKSPQKRPLFLGIWKIMDKNRVFIPGFVLVLLCYCLIDDVSIIFGF